VANSRTSGIVPIASKLTEIPMVELAVRVALKVIDAEFSLKVLDLKSTSSAMLMFVFLRGVY